MNPIHSSEWKRPAPCICKGDEIVWSAWKHAGKVVEHLYYKEMPMEKNREGYLVSNTQRECTNCRGIFPKTSKTVTLCNNCNSERVKGESQEMRMYRRAKRRAKEQGLDFDLSVDDIVIPVECPILGIRLKHRTGRSGGNDESPSLDKKVPHLGYTKGNVWVISHLANRMKANATPEMLRKFAEWVLNN